MLKHFKNKIKMELYYRRKYLSDKSDQIAPKQTSQNLSSFNVNRHLISKRNQFFLQLTELIQTSQLKQTNSVLV